MGQPDGGFPAELQKIVLKGQRTASRYRPGSLLPDVDLEAVKQHLRSKYRLCAAFDEKAMEQKAISYALYPKVYEDYCEHFEMYNDVTRLESHVYFYGLRKGEETYPFHRRRKRADHQIHRGSPNPMRKVYRTLTFEVNGCDA